MPEANRHAPPAGQAGRGESHAIAVGRGWHGSRSRAGMELLQDLRYGIRSFAKAPGFTALALLTIALGIGVKRHRFQLRQRAAPRPAPAVRDPGTLVSVFTSDFSGGLFGSSLYPDYCRLSKRRRPSTGWPLSGRDRPTWLRERPVPGAHHHCFPEFFDVLGVTPALGRRLGAADATPDAPPVAVIADGLWRRAFGGSPSAIGSQVVLDGRRSRSSASRRRVSQG